METLQKIWNGCSCFQHSGLSFKHKNTVQNCLVHILKTVVQTFNEGNVQYMIIEGSLLGAIRDKNFIYYDDDIDICVNDWNAFQTIILPILQTKLSVTKLNNNWYQCSTPSCETIKNAKDTIHADIVNANYSTTRLLPGVPNWTDTSYLFEKPLQLYTMNNIQCTGPNYQLATEYLTQRYGNWKKKNCGGNQLLISNWVVGILLFISVLCMIKVSIWFIILILILFTFVIGSNYNSSF